MAWTILYKFRASILLFIIGSFFGGGMIYKYKEAHIIQQQNEIQSLIKANKDLKFNIENNNKSQIIFESRIALLDKQNEMLKEQESEMEYSLRKHVRINNQLLLILQNGETHSISNTSTRINEESNSLKFIDPVEFTKAINTDFLQCNKNIVQLNTLIDWINANISYYNGNL